MNYYYLYISSVEMIHLWHMKCLPCFLDGSGFCGLPAPSVSFCLQLHLAFACYQAKLSSKN